MSRAATDGEQTSIRVEAEEVWRSDRGRAEEEQRRRQIILGLVSSNE